MINSDLIFLIIICYNKTTYFYCQFYFTVKTKNYKYQQDKTLNYIVYPK